MCIYLHTSVYTVWGDDIQDPPAQENYLCMVRIHTQVHHSLYTQLLHILPVREEIYMCSASSYKRTRYTLTYTEHQRYIYNLN